PRPPRGPARRPGRRQEDDHVLRRLEHLGLYPPDRSPAAAAVRAGAAVAGVLRRKLGDGYWIVEEGLNGRTTGWDDPLGPFRSGKELLAPCLMTHEPIDLVVVMLGTNDLKRRFGVGARDTMRRSRARAPARGSTPAPTSGRATTTASTSTPRTTNGSAASSRSRSAGCWHD